MRKYREITNHQNRSTRRKDEQDKGMGCRSCEQNCKFNGGESGKICPRYFNKQRFVKFGDVIGPRGQVRARDDEDD
jgi:hypothetical protein